MNSPAIQPSIQPPPPRGSAGQRAGFSLTELMIASMIVVMLMGLAISVYTMSLRQAREGILQISLIGKGRATEQKLVKYVQLGRAIGLNSNVLEIVRQDMSVAGIRYIDADNDPLTVEDNVVEYDPNIDVAGDELTVCNQVTPIPGEPMFQLMPTQPVTVMFAMHLGEVAPTNGTPDLLPGTGYQGMEMRFSATPRNLKIFFQ
jgi:prepilin-type N-terminal cleavage/methylation domain-containing protein